MTDEMKMTLNSKDYHNKAVVANRKIYSRFFDEIEKRAEQGFFNITITDKSLTIGGDRDRFITTLEAYGFFVSESNYSIYITW